MRERIVFYLNGKRHEVGAELALRTVADYLRNGESNPHAERLTGTKIACSEGDCGACTVLVGTFDGHPRGPNYRSIDSCIAFLFQMDGKHIVTVEGLSVASGLTSIQSAMVDCHGSQCGFCTPGFVMALHGLVESARSDNGRPAKTIAEDDVRLGLSGNLCRCTGYLQILEAAASVDTTTVPHLNDLFHDPAMQLELAELNQQTVCAIQRGHQEAVVAIPRTLDDLLSFRSQLPNARLIAGATDVGVQYNHGKFRPLQVISTANVPQLKELSAINGRLTIGAATTWREIDEYIANILPEYHNIIVRFGSPQVRHTGTLAGNLANASPIADSLPFHFIAESVIEVANQYAARQIDIRDFYRGYKNIDLQPDEVIQRIITPLPGETTAIKLYKISKRRDMDISTVTAAFWFELDGDQIREARVAYGGVGPVVKRLSNVEDTLQGGDLTLQTMESAGKLARTEVAPISDVRGSSEFRLQLVENLFVKCYHDLSSQRTAEVT